MINFNMKKKTSASGSNLVIKKDFFITSRSEDIRKYYQFFPKVFLNHKLSF
jgi:hypothetical protein